MMDAGRAHLAAGDVALATVVLDEVLRRVPDEPSALALRAGIAVEAGDPTAAVGLLERATAARPRDPALARRLGEVRHAAGDLAGAVAALRRAVSLAPRDADLLDACGQVCLEAGELEVARECFRRAFAFDPGAPGVALDYVRSRRFDGASARETAATVRRLARRPELPPLARADLEFALAKLADDIGNHGAAAEHYVAANRLVRGTVEFDAGRHRAVVDTIIETFTPALFERCRGYGDPSPLPVLVVGMPRSGTTLVEQILAAHPEVHGAGELDALDAASRTLARALSRAAGRSVRYPACAAATTPEAAAEAGGAYVARLSALAAGAVRCIDKMPTNFLHLGLAALVCPGARVIHCRRDPMDTGLSIWQQQFGSGHVWAYDLDDIAAFHREHDRLMAHWRAVLPLPLLEVDYESLVGDVETVSRQMVAFLDLAWSDACLAFHASRRPVGTASSWQVRAPVHGDSVGRWRRYGSALDPLRRGLGLPEHES